MAQRCGRLVAVLMLAIAAGACGPNPLFLETSPVAWTRVTAAPTPGTSPGAPNLDDDIGSVLVASWAGRGLPASVRSLLVNGRVGGVLLFASNFDGPAGLKAISDQLTQLAASACLNHPILLMLDEEGGQVNRVTAPFAPPSQLVAGQGGAANVRAVERTSAAGLRALGVGLNLAPVADVRDNPADQVIGDRSFGSAPGAVAPLVAAAVQGLHAGGVGATLKHFPGLGGAAGDPHVAVPTDPESEAQWEQTRLPAFEAGIAFGADAVMTTALYAPGLGGGSTLAMFSAAIVGRLRTQLHFGGVIVSDSVSMGGVGALYPLPQATVLALAAGNDMVLLGNGSPAYEATALASVRSAALAGRLDPAKLHASAQRVDALRDRWGRPFPHCTTPIS